MKMQSVIFLQLAIMPIIILGDKPMHPHIVHKIQKRSTKNLGEQENNAEFWTLQAQQTLKFKLEQNINRNTAKNVIFFLGDGMSIPTLAASRVYLGGEEKQLAFEKFPYTGLSKTYCVDTQVADSACSATAYLSGVKGNYATIGVTGHVKRGDCPAMLNSTNHVQSIARAFQLQSKATGFVTTARVTHASPAGVYAHTAERDWESDADVIKSNYDPVTCRDIASQLVHGESGRGLNVLLGGGRAKFLPKTIDQNGCEGERLDNVDLIKEWLQIKLEGGAKATYVSNREQLLNVEYNKTDFLLGLFNSDHLTFNLKRDQSKEPSLQEMTEAAIKVLSRSENGYFLFVEGAKIDMAHHLAKAKMSLDETNEFSKAVQAAVDLTSESDTLIVVTSDHAHTLSYSGYAPRGNDILGTAGMANDSKPYTTLAYANGPGYKMENGQRHDVSNDVMTDNDYVFPGIYPLPIETHGGDDVAIFARGPWAHLFTGVMEQNVIPHLIAYAACVSKNNPCDKNDKEWSSNIMNLLKKES